jgi:ribosome-associated translation inhibitor RaiA
MKLSIRTRIIEVTDALRDLISRRLKFALDTFGDRVTTASVYLADVNGPRGGVDKTCQIQIAVRGVGDIVVKRNGVTAEAALTRASRHLKYLVSEALRQAQRPATTESIRRLASTA